MAKSATVGIIKFTLSGDAKRVDDVNISAFVYNSKTSATVVKETLRREYMSIIANRVRNLGLLDGTHALRVTFNIIDAEYITINSITYTIYNKASS